MMVAAGYAHAQSQSAPEAGEVPTQARASTDSTAESSAPEAPASPIAIDQLTLSDDMLAAVGVRPIENHRVEALVSSGTDSTHHAAVRATDTLAGAGVELTGTAFRSDVLGDRTAAGARIEHAGEHDVLRANASYGLDHVGLVRQSFTTDTSTAAYRAAWTGWRAANRFELQAYGEHTSLRDVRSAAALDLDGDLYGAHAGLASRRVQAFGLDHEFGGDIDITQATGMSTQSDGDPALQNMTTLRRTKHARKRFLSAYIHDTIRVIESLDVRGGFVFEQWAWLTNINSIYGPDPSENMDNDGPDAIRDLLMGPRVGAIYRASPEVALEAQAYRQLRTPTWQQLMRPIQNGNVLTTADDRLHAATISGAELGPVLTMRSVEARAKLYWNEIASPIATVGVADDTRAITNLDHARETGVQAAATWRVAKPVLAGVDYTFTNARITEASAYPQLAGKQLVQTPRHRATALLAYDAPKLATLTGAVRYVDRRFEDDRNTIVAKPFAVVDAMAARKLTHGLAGFVGIENLFDRRYVANQAGVDTFGAPRLVQVGLRLDSARW
ncbi:MAG TPA: TonB-dependent receptor [Kofleriaceae bacterium]